MKNVVIIILSILVIVLGGYLVWDKVIDKDKINQDVNGESETKVDNTKVSTSDYVLANQLLRTMSIGVCGGGYNYDIGVNETLTHSNLSNDVKIAVSYKNAFGYNRIEKFSKHSIEESYKNFFGSTDFELPNKFSIHYIFTSYELASDNTDQFVTVANGGGCAIGSSHYLLDSIKVTENEMIIDTIYYILEDEYLDGESEPSNIYITSSYENPDAKIKVASRDISSEEKLEAIKDYKDKFIEYRFTFKSSEDHYIFDSIKRIN